MLVDFQARPSVVENRVVDKNEAGQAERCGQALGTKKQAKNCAFEAFGHKRLEEEERGQGGVNRIDGVCAQCAVRSGRMPEQQQRLRLLNQVAGWRSYKPQK